MTTPELAKRWLGGKCTTVTDASYDFRVGGSYRNAYRTQEGYEFAFTGTYLEISDDRVVHTESFSGAPGEARITITLTEQGGKTTMVMVMAFPSQETRDMVVSTGMADGAGESYDELEKLLANL